MTTGDPQHAKLLRRLKLDVALQATALAVAVVVMLFTSGSTRTFVIILGAVVLVNLAWRTTVLLYTLHHPEVADD